MSIPLLVALTVVAALTFLWLRTRILVWREARRRVRSLGEAMETPSQGETATVEGLLALSGEGCQALEDEAAVAASTLEAEGSVLLRRRASGKLWLERGQDVIPLEGEAQVLVGSVETHPRVSMRRLHAPLSARITEQLDSVPASVVSFRTLKVGARVAARGRIELEHVDGDDNYRDKPVARFVIRADDGPILLAALGRPRVRGAWMSVLSGVRSPKELALPLLAALLGLAGVSVGWLLAADRSPDPPVVTPALPSAVTKLTGAVCLDLEDDYAAKLDEARWCETVDDCIAQERGGIWFALDGCVRIYNENRSTEAADALAHRWLEGGCAHGYAICEPPPRVQCSSGRCVERPPPPIPASWRREELLDDLWLYVPPDLVDTGASSEDSIGKVFASESMDLVLDYGRMSGEISRERDAPEIRDVAEYDDLDSNGVKGILRREPGSSPKRAFGVAAYFPDPPCSSAKCAYFTSGRATLFVSAWCDTEETCENAERSLRSIRFRGSYAKK